MEYRLARKEEVKNCAQMLGESFQDYIFFNMFPMEKQKRITFTNYILETGAKAAYRRNELLIAVEKGKILSAAIIESPEKSRSGLMEYFRCGGLNVLITGGLKNTFGWLNMMTEGEAAIHSMQEPHWCLLTLAVSCQCKGQGIGSRMIQEGIIPWIKTRGSGILVLITNSEINCNFYKKNGFKEFHESIIQRNGMSMGNWSFRMEIKSEDLDKTAVSDMASGI